MTLDDLYDNFAFFENWEEKYQYVIDLSNRLEALDDCYKTDEWKIKGCQSQVWLVPQYSENKLHFRGDSDALLVRGIIAIVLIIYNDKSPEEIKNIQINDIFAKLGLEENLTPSRRNGMMSMVAKIIEYASNV